MSETARGGVHRWWLVLFLSACLVHLVALYTPGSPEPSAITIPGLDKVVHVGLFAVPALLARLAIRSWWPIIVLLLHVPVSEIVQWAFIPLRSGDPLDALADLVGLSCGVFFGERLSRRWVKN